MYLCIYVSMYIYIYIYVSMYLCIYVSIYVRYVRTYVCMYHNTCISTISIYIYISIIHAHIFQVIPICLVSSNRPFPMGPSTHRSQDAKVTVSAQAVATCFETTHFLLLTPGFFGRPNQWVYPKNTKQNNGVAENDEKSLDLGFPIFQHGLLTSTLKTVAVRSHLKYLSDSVQKISEVTLYQPLGYENHHLIKFK